MDRPRSVAYERLTLIVSVNERATGGSRGRIPLGLLQVGAQRSKVSLSVRHPLPDFLKTDACGDVVAARGEAEKLLSRVGGGRLVRRLASLMLTAAIVDLTGRLDRGLKPSDIIPLLIALIPPDGRPFADSPMQFLQFAEAELAELDEPCRSAAIELCIAATSNSGKLYINGRQQENSKKTA